MSFICTDISAQGSQGFPFYRSFLDFNEEGITKTANAEITSKGMKFTDAESQVGGFHLPNHLFTTKEGLLIEFEYMMYPTTSDGVTDGITMFLVEVSTSYPIEDLVLGSNGAAFGYTYNWSMPNHSGLQKKGMPGAYLAVGLDQGPFKEIRFQGEELRNGIAYGRINGTETTSWQNVDYNTPSNITIRGAAARVGQTVHNRNFDKGYLGYPVLITRHTGGDSDPTEKRNVVCIGLDTSSGNYGTLPPSNIPRIDQEFNITGKKEFTSPKEAAYRKAIIKLEPREDKGPGFQITVTIQHGEEKSLVIEKFTYPTTVKYMENATPISLIDEFPRVVSTSPKVTYTVDVPETLAIGFTGSTGETAYTNIIKNLRITPAYGAATANDDIRGHRRGPTTIRPFDNDWGCNRESDGRITESKDNLDPQTFRFWIDESSPPQQGDNVFEKTTADGKWRYDPATAQVLFFPRSDFNNSAAKIMYDIKAKSGTSFDDEMFRSSLAVISVTIEDNQPG